MSSFFMNNNFIDSTVVSTTASSTATGFSKDNIFLNDRRDKVWRSAGYWDITSSNNTLIFNEGGSNLTATVAVGTYTDTTFFAAVKSALDAAGSNTYTVSRETSSNKIKIDPAGVCSLVESGSTLLDIMGFNSGSDYASAGSHTADDMVLHTNEYLQIDFGVSVDPTAFVLAGRRNNALKLSTDSVIKLQGNSTSSFGSPDFTKTLSYDTNAIWHYNATGIHTEALRYWRIYLEDTQNPNEYIEISNIYLGSHLNVSRGGISFGATFNAFDSSQTVYSEGQESFTDIGVQTTTSDFTWQGLTNADKESFDTLFKDFGLHKPFWIQFDPTTVLSTTHTKYLRLCKFLSPPSFSIVSPGNWFCSMSVREEV